MEKGRTLQGAQVSFAEAWIFVPGEADAAFQMRL